MYLHTTLLTTTLAVAAGLDLHICLPEEEGQCQGTDSDTVSICASGYWQHQFLGPYHCVNKQVVPATLTALTSSSATDSHALEATTTSLSHEQLSANSETSPAVYIGDITHYDVGLGSCGWTNDNDDDVVAIPHGMMNNGVNPNVNPRCGTYIIIRYLGLNHSAQIVDTCGGCDGASIDLSPTFFTVVAPNGDGRVSGVEWWYNDTSAAV
ncbi:hypothetical protein LTR17_027096 [Elasticomyces elasticus]|nr:hypothetical protein LTR17_027096 [Elasticomyces elasticus]